MSIESRSYEGAAATTAAAAPAARRASTEIKIAANEDTEELPGDRFLIFTSKSTARQATCAKKQRQNATRNGLHSTTARLGIHLDEACRLGLSRRFFQLSETVTAVTTGMTVQWREFRQVRHEWKKLLHASIQPTLSQERIGNSPPNSEEPPPGRTLLRGCQHETFPLVYGSGHA